MSTSSPSSSSMPTEPFPYFHLLPPSYSLADLPALSTAQLASAWILHPDYKESLHKEPIETLFWERKEKARGREGATHGHGQDRGHANGGDRFAGFELIDLGFKIPSNLNELTSAQLAALPFHSDFNPSSHLQNAARIFLERGENDWEAALTMKDTTEPAGATPPSISSSPVVREDVSSGPKNVGTSPARMYRNGADVVPESAPPAENAPLVKENASSSTTQKTVISQPNRASRSPSRKTPSTSAKETSPAPSPEAFANGNHSPSPVPIIKSEFDLHSTSSSNMHPHQPQPSSPSVISQERDSRSEPPVPKEKKPKGFRMLTNLFFDVGDGPSSSRARGTSAPPKRQSITSILAGRAASPERVKSESESDSASESESEEEVDELAPDMEEDQNDVKGKGKAKAKDVTKKKKPGRPRTKSDVASSSDTNVPKKKGRPRKIRPSSPERRSNEDLSQSSTSSQSVEEVNISHASARFHRAESAAPAAPWMVYLSKLGQKLKKGEVIERKDDTDRATDSAPEVRPGALTVADDESVMASSAIDEDSERFIKREESTAPTDLGGYDYQPEDQVMNDADDADVEDQLVNGNASDSEESEMDMSDQEDGAAKISIVVKQVELPPTPASQGRTAGTPSGSRSLSRSPSATSPAEVPHSPTPVTSAVPSRSPSLPAVGKVENASPGRVVLEIKGLGSKGDLEIKGRSKTDQTTAITKPARWTEGIDWATPFLDNIGLDLAQKTPQETSIDVFTAQLRDSPPHLTRRPSADSQPGTQQASLSPVVKRTDSIKAETDGTRNRGSHDNYESPDKPARTASERGSERRSSRTDPSHRSRDRSPSPHQPHHSRRSSRHSPEPSTSRRPSDTCTSRRRSPSPRGRDRRSKSPPPRRRSGSPPADRQSPPPSRRRSPTPPLRPQQSRPEPDTSHYRQGRYRQASPLPSLPYSAQAPIQAPVDSVRGSRIVVREEPLSSLPPLAPIHPREADIENRLEHAVPGYITSTWSVLRLLGFLSGSLLSDIWTLLSPDFLEPPIAVKVIENYSHAETGCLVFVAYKSRQDADMARTSLDGVTFSSGKLKAAHARDPKKGVWEWGMTSPTYRREIEAPSRRVVASERQAGRQELPPPPPRPAPATMTAVRTPFDMPVPSHLVAPLSELHIFNLPNSVDIDDVWAYFPSSLLGCALQGPSQPRSEGPEAWLAFAHVGDRKNTTFSHIAKKRFPEGDRSMWYDSKGRRRTPWKWSDMSKEFRVRHATEWEAAKADAGERQISSSRRSNSPPVRPMRAKSPPRSSRTQYSPPLPHRKESPPSPPRDPVSRRRESLQPVQIQAPPPLQPRLLTSPSVQRTPLPAAPALAVTQRSLDEILAALSPTAESSSPPLPSSAAPPSGAYDPTARFALPVRPIPAKMSESTPPPPDLRIGHTRKRSFASASNEEPLSRSVRRWGGDQR